MKLIITTVAIPSYVRSIPIGLILEGATWEFHDEDLIMKYKIGDKLKDCDGNEGIVVIMWNDGDICTIENDAAHPNPVVVED